MAKLAGDDAGHAENAKADRTADDDRGAKRGVENAAKLNGPLLHDAPSQQRA
jgi:hypothetical protein